MACLLVGETQIVGKGTVVEIAFSPELKPGMRGNQVLYEAVGQGVMFSNSAEVSTPTPVSKR